MNAIDLHYLPKCPIDPERYDRLYAFNHQRDDQLPESVGWKEIRLHSGLSERQVYRLLPSAPDFEYSGYLTKSYPLFQGRLVECGCAYGDA